MQATKLSLPCNPSSSSQITSLLFEPISNTLATMHTDSSIHLLPSLSPFSTAPPQSQTSIPPFCTSSTFFHLQSSPNSPSHTLFLVAGPKKADSRIYLRFWILEKSKNLFLKARLECNQRGFFIDDKKYGVLIDLCHGVCVKVVGSVNVFVLHSVSERKIWVFSAKVEEEEESCVCVKLIKCGVIDCNVGISEISVSFGFLVLGEVNGVRVFSVRQLVKGRVKRKEKRIGSGGSSYACLGNGNCRGNEPAEMSSDGCTGKTEMNNASAKLRARTLKQDSAVFVAFDNLEAPTEKFSTIKAVSIHSLSQKKFIILDSVGDLHLLCLFSMLSGSEVTGHLRSLNHLIKVQMLAVLPDVSTSTQTFWISDGFYSLHAISLSDMEASLNENDASEMEEKRVQISAIEAVFASEKIQNLIPLSANAVLILGQGQNCAFQ
ncbi:hypothetical protein IFM89_000896 [Coptis chinensis]|uniref:Uncharacterized protein n=1 Tax=Coptis chinensis TaxID=261450 RepID=A0A835II85_9MAGN|nr:hypothetical protein IFM89_000896 [Coptis chinensis]